MNWDKIIINILSIGFEVYLTLLFFSIFWKAKTLSRPIATLGIAVISAVYAISIIFLQESLFFPIIVLALKIGLAFFYIAKLQSRILYPVILFVISALAEILTGLTLSQIGGVAVKDSRADTLAYFMGVFISKLLILIAIKVLQYYKKDRHQIGGRYTLAVLFTPLYSLAIVIIIYMIANDSVNRVILFLCQLSTLILIVSNIFIFNILDKIAKTELIRQRYDFVQDQLQAQIHHYGELYKSEIEIRKMRHDMRANLISIRSLIADGRADEAGRTIDHLTSGMSRNLVFSETGNPVIDSILYAQMERAKKSDVTIVCRIVIAQTLYIDPMDLGVILVNALDNAI
ncbi:MAG: hypothetical protein ACYC5K_10935, partial [Saccharofermentanales bacterium]